MNKNVMIAIVVVVAGVGLLTQLTKDSEKPKAGTEEQTTTQEAATPAEETATLVTAEMPEDIDWLTTEKIPTIASPNAQQGGLMISDGGIDPERSPMSLTCVNGRHRTPLRRRRPRSESDPDPPGTDHRGDADLRPRRRSRRAEREHLARHHRSDRRDDRNRIEPDRHHSR